MPALVEAVGRHDPAAGRGALTATLAPLDVGRLDLATLLPPLAGRVEETAGRVSARGVLSWTREHLASDIRLVLRDLTLVGEALGVRRLNGVVRLTRPWPPATPPDQRLAAAQVQAGLPLEDVLVAFRLDGRGGIEVEEGSLRLAGGAVRLSPARLALDGSAGTTALEVEEVDMERLAALVSLDGLAADGRLKGRIPLRLSGGGVSIDGGRLAAVGPGRLSYAPAAVPATLQAGGAGASLMFQALRDFRYRRLEMTVDGRIGGDLKAALHIAGANPDLYEGYPVEFNLNVEGKLDRVVAQAMDTYRIPDAVRERLEGLDEE
jgi:hypothetical protein